MEPHTVYIQYFIKRFQNRKKNPSVYAHSWTHPPGFPILCKTSSVPHFPPILLLAATFHLDRKRKTKTGASNHWLGLNKCQLLNSETANKRFCFNKAGSKGLKMDKNEFHRSTQCKLSCYTI